MDEIITVVPENGIHARPASKIVEAANRYECTVEIEAMNDSGKKADASSMVNLTTLGVTGGEKVRLIAEGQNAAEAIEEIKQILTTSVTEMHDDT